MSEVWPFDVMQRLRGGSTEAIRPFKCVLLMPFEGRFNQVAEVVRQTVDEFCKGFGVLPRVSRLDWVTSSGVIQQEIWEEISDADLIFCDITGYNPNVMYEAGVCAAWKELTQVVFLKDHFFKQQAAFDVQPIRYTEYSLTSDGAQDFQNKIKKLVLDVLASFPDRQGSPLRLTWPLEISFKDNREDPRIYTPPYAHRRVIDGSLEFGSIKFFDQSWATIGKERLHNFTLEFSAWFSSPSMDGNTWIGVGLRSQHFWANYSHLLYLKRGGMVVITELNENPPNFYEDRVLRPPQSIDLDSSHQFRVAFDETALTVQVDDFETTLPVAQMSKVLFAGPIRFQAYQSWMRISDLKVNVLP